jgi:tetratricopeptide (TPR) repeat protein
MFKQNVFTKMIILFIIVLFISCTTTSYLNNPEKRKERIPVLVRKIRANQNDWNALRELGIILVKSRDYKRGRILLERTLRINPQDPQTVFYYGLSLEFCNEEKRAFKVYRNYDKLPRLSRYRRMAQARYDFLNRKMMRQEAKALIRQEGQLGTKAFSPKSIAVFPFSYQGSDMNYANLGKGLCEMIITDLSQVKGLKLIERIRLQALMEEMKLEQTGLMDTKTAPRFGQLLSAGQIVCGAYDILSEDRFRMDVELWNLFQSQSPPITVNRTDNLNRLFTMEKRIVFGIIGKMGIELTQLERERIMRVPTQNMQAFMAYCMGLGKQDAGLFEEAAASFTRAATLDPRFEIAEQKAQESNSMKEAGTGKETVLASLDKIESQGISSPVVDDLVSNRLQIVSTNIGSNFVPGQDNRDATEEATTAGADVGLDNLPDPPRPPMKR